MWCEFLYVVCAVSRDLDTSGYAAVMYSDITVSVLMHICSLNVMFCANVSYVSQWPNMFLPQTVAPNLQSLFYIRIRMCAQTFSCSVLLSQC